LSGISLFELLTAAGLLLILSGLFFQTFSPVLERQNWLFGQQSEVTTSLVARERLRAVLNNAQLVSQSDLTPAMPGRKVLLELFRPTPVATSDFGDVPFIDLREMELFDRTHRIQVVLLDSGEMQESDTGNTFRRLIWAMGPGAEVQVTQAPDGRRVDITATGVRLAGRPQESHWTHTMTFLPR
jgi:hypothetical protein